jgi:hypothetical protein
MRQEWCEGKLLGCKTPPQSRECSRQAINTLPHSQYSIYIITQEAVTERLHPTKCTYRAPLHASICWLYSSLPENQLKATDSERDQNPNLKHETL